MMTGPLTGQSKFEVWRLEPAGIEAYAASTVACSAFLSALARTFSLSDFS